MNSAYLITRQILNKKTIVLLILVIVMLLSSTLLVLAEERPAGFIEGDKSRLDSYYYYLAVEPSLSNPHGLGDAVPFGDIVTDEDGCPKHKDSLPMRIFNTPDSLRMRPVWFTHKAIVVDEFGHNPDEIKGGLARTAYVWATEIFGDGLIEQTRGLLKVSTDGSYSKLWESAETIYRAIAGIGVAIMLVYFLTELIEKITQENFNLEGFVKMIIRLLAAVIIINNGLPLFSGALEFSNKFLDVVANPNPVQIVKPNQPPPGTSYGDGSDYGDEVIGYTDGGSNNNSTTEPVDTSGNAAQGVVDSYWERATKTTGKWSKAISDLIIGLSMLVELIVPYLMTWLIKVVVQVLCYSRAIELFVRAAFAPIGMANIFEGGTNSSGFRYFKKFLAVGLQGATIIVILLGYSALAGVIHNASLDGTLVINSIIANQVILGFATLTLVLKSQSWANDIVGV